jgi:hypothetical protein
MNLSPLSHPLQKKLVIVRRISKQLTTTKNNPRTNEAPLVIARWLPTMEPPMFANASGIASEYQTFPEGMKYRRAARFVPTFTTFADTEAPRKSSPNTTTKAKTRKLPVPGPRNPS